EEPLLEHIASLLRIERAEIVDAAWVDNGPGWVGVLLASADAVLALEPEFVDLDLGVVGPYPPGSPLAFEVRAFFPKNGATAEDPDRRAHGREDRHPDGSRPCTLRGSSVFAGDPRRRLRLRLRAGRADVRRHAT